MLSHVVAHELHQVMPLLTAGPPPPPGGGGGGSVIPDTPASLPAGLSQAAAKIFGWAKGGVYALGGIFLVVCAGMIIAGRRNRGQVSVEGAIGVVWVIVGLTLAGCAAMLASQFVS